MIAFNTFFNIFPDELLYSGIARFQFYTGLSTLWIQENFFGNGKANPKVYIPNCLGYFYEKFGEPYNPRYILNNHSVYNYYASFALQSSKDRLYSDLVTNESTGNSVKCIGLQKSSVYWSSLHYCCDCVEKDIKTVGVPYFHASHNLSGIILCHEHGTVLQKYPERSNYTCLLKGNISNTKLQKPAFYDVHMRLAELSYELLQHEFDFNRTIVTAKIASLIRQKGFANSMDNIDQRKWASYVQSQYDNDLLDDLGISTQYSHEYWTQKVTRCTQNNIPPLQYLLIINLLSGSIQEFNNVNICSSRYVKPKKVPVIKEPDMADENMSRYKNILMKLITNHPEYSRSEIKGKAITPFNYVRQNDLLWFETWMPPCFLHTRKTPPKKHYDEKLDQEYLTSLISAYNEALKIIPEIRITKLTLERRIDGKKAIRQELYPFSFEFINSISETTEEFRLRRCKRIVDDCLESSIIPTLTHIRAKSGFGVLKKIEPFQDKLEAYINEQSNEILNGRKKPDEKNSIFPDPLSE